MRSLQTTGLHEPWLSTKATVVFAWNQLDQSSRAKLVLATVILSALSLLDFVALILLATVGAVVISASSGEFEKLIPEWVPFQDLPPTQLIPLWGGVAAVLIGLKTLLSWRLTRRVYLFMARREPEIAGTIYSTYLTAPFALTQTIPRAQIGAALGTGSGALMVALASVVTMVGDVVLLLVLTSLMLLTSPWLLLGFFGYFLLLSWLVARVIGGRTSRFGKAMFEASLEAAGTVETSIGLLPDIRLYGTAEEFQRRLYQDQLRAATLTGQQQSLHQAPRYIMDVGVIVGFAVVATVAFATQNAAEATFTVAVFTLASSRVVPALQRINNARGRLRLSTAQSWALRPVLEWVSAESTQSPDIEASNGPTDSSPTIVEGGFQGGRIVLRDVGFRYPGSDSWSVVDASLVIPPGSQVALVGRSGSGKSTLAYLISGLLEPSTGGVIRDQGPSWRTEVALVPQDVYASPDTVRNNVTLEVNGQPVDDAAVWNALRAAQVEDVVAALPDGLDTLLGERGSRLSGGEVQRIGVARALYRNPRLLILDEATSGLDAHTEQRLVDAIRQLPQDMTLVSVAHRLATVREADIVVYMEEGLIVASGTFDEVAAQVPHFATAAQLQGLDVAPMNQGS